ncbi:hypothetical protein GOQ29_01825 [Clostridium sp. D2Q-14]|uniref:RAMP superfamily CRISPR-associated protein n=1 Tax=Anaeromonas gelatinilytica TaxID=2683194 RepID=UPI00193AF947|nr:RAMP superfamily CRISPR-associated protein [Anaeromonas gelatinilytica]MBS4534352.1 hypothetical protein [Anaeromonas gelatinilytica]
MYYYRIIEIKNLEPLKIGSKGNQSTYSEPTTEHIPGSTIRGAIIGELIRLKLFNDKTKDNILLNMECYNAYPYFNGSFYLPKPLHLRTDKHKWRKAKANGQSKLKLANLFEEKDAGKNQLEYSFVSIKDNMLLGRKIDKEYRLHHFTYKSSPQNKEQENIFRYQAISSENSFKAIIRYKQELEKYMKTLFKENRILYLGGSKGSGYGKSKITATRLMKEFKEVKEELGINSYYENKRKEIVITCLSDCLFRNEFGQPINHISENYLSELICKGAKLEKQFIQTGETQGYNTTWKARYPKETTIKAGSILKYVFEEELTNDEMSTLIDSLEGKLLGNRVQDGYGWLGVNIKYPGEIFIGEDKINNKEVEGQLIDLDNLIEDCKVKQTFDILISGMNEAKERWLRTFYSLIKDAENTEERLTISKDLNKNQLRNMEYLIEQFLGLGKGEIENNIILDRFYANDNKVFSLNGCNFKLIWEFLNGRDNEMLTRFANTKLSSQRGRLFYFKTNQDSRKFIAELLKTALHIERMRGN